MKMQGFIFADAAMERSPGQKDEIETGDVVNDADGAPISIGYVRWGAGSRLTETMRVDDVMIVLEGGLEVTSEGKTVSAAPGAIVHMPKGVEVTITAGADGARTAYVTYPNWRTARS